MIFNTNGIKQSINNINQASIELSQGVRDPNLIDNKVKLMENQASLKLQTSVIRAKDDMLGTLIDAFK